MSDLSEGKVHASSVKLEDKRPNTPNITWQHLWPYDESRNALSQSSFADIPNEILLRIFQLLSIQDLCNVSSVCRLFKMIVDQDNLWKYKCNTTTRLYSKSFKQIYMDWMYEKYLRNTQLQKMGRWTRTGCANHGTIPPLYPLRPMSKHQFETISGFLQHPNLSSDITIKLSVDIANNAHQLLRLLGKAIQFQEQWQQSTILKQMITRYYRFMQLKASHPPNLLLIPTLDIELVWQTHLLRPKMYKVDCLRLFGRVIDHSSLMTEVEQFFKEQA
ncbi:unnamed protein product [Rotaria sordida]|uniref:F-box domain-containing protein n=1 Tax=Rotaria sordida TaxID=392033 RepID=A0A819R687_9BILA|nr:unnamed protein product [Rotaria sordida]CAF0971099.1 unnamed protein product [Rotaria sordida]CAF4003119.1 unnamed protein product [Rotaria sordida]CAF4037172.1 unnamed protein product [Rotaria sordida]